MKENRIERETFTAFIKDRNNSKTIILIICSVALIAGVSLARNRLSGLKYIVSEDGTISGVVRDEADVEASFPLRIEAEVGGQERHKEVTLVLKPDGGDEDGSDESYVRDASAVFDAGVSELLARLSRAGGKKVMLPDELSDGTRIVWRKGQGTTEVLIIFMAPVLIWLLYVNNEKKKRDAVKEKTICVQRELPSFNDELLLLLRSGLIFRDAFRRIADGRRMKSRASYLDARIIEIDDEVENGVSDIVNVMSRKAEEIQVTEFSRLTGLIKDNQLRGLDIVSKLKSESEILWDIRKKNAEERGRMAETRLTLPLAILLLVLVLVTAAPAIIQI